MTDKPDLTPPPPEEIWALVKMAKPDIFFIRHITEAYEGLCVPTTVPNSDGLVLLQSDKSLEDDLHTAVKALTDEFGIEVIRWGTGPTPR
jgi:hypothetical protein